MGELGLRPTGEVFVRDEDVSSFDAVFVRTNPARAAQPGINDAALGLLALARDRGVVVVNDPDALRTWGSKLSLALVPPQWRPETLITRDPAAIRAFVAERPGGAVVKPLQGTRGQDVFFLRVDDPNLNAIVSAACRDAWVVAQSYVPEAPEGDTRLVLIDGEPLRIGDHVAAIRRVPGPGDFRSNVHVGARPEPGLFDDRLARIAADVGRELVARHIFLAGLDVIGGKVVEVNVHATGGLFDANRFAGVDFTEAIVDALAARVQAAGHPSR
jgi:glutathione synthase